ncbi:MAG TPA: GNAT family N-acetyltransferase [Candidatus Eisenbacteria bacterium]|nr:GNAT family N-acetyltransferase [Candidatus Eisenbacteria bacterium]
MSLSLRQLTPSDVDLLREIRLEGLRLSPEAFGSTFEDEEFAPLEKYLGWLTNSQVFGAFDGPQLVGIAAFGVFTGRKDAHKGWLRAMYVRPANRRTGVSRLLVQAVLDAARTRVEQIQLAVVSTNIPAIRLYQSFGFTQYGLEPRALKHHGIYSDEILMSLRF